MSKYRLNFMLFVTFLLLTNSVSARILISPVNLDIAPGSQFTALRLINQSDNEINFQVRVVDWETNEISKAIILSPVIATLAPAQEQVIRIINRSGKASTANQSLYRLIVDELPSARGDDKVRSTLELRMRYALPLTVGGPDMHINRGMKPEKLEKIWQGKLDVTVGDNQISIKNKNPGVARISKLSVFEPEQESEEIYGGLLGYVLGNSESTFPLDYKRAQVSTLKMNVNGAYIVVPVTDRRR
jgi:P pilus assembly chaperone PapD